MRELMCVNLLSAPACVCIPRVTASIHLLQLGCISVRVAAAGEKKR